MQWDDLAGFGVQKVFDFRAEKIFERELHFLEVNFQRLWRVGHGADLRFSACEGKAHVTQPVALV